ncbi:MAG: hypothetical protein E6J14_06235 [Chloroflexi bacterium]|nr:MAG: hypothetical protein E6J14_06235 [Chloroflexota bacterium]
MTKDDIDPGLVEALGQLHAISRDPQRHSAGRAALMVAAAQRRTVAGSRRPAWLRRLTVASLSVAGAGGLLGGLVAASANALPDSPLYGVKRAVEGIELQLADDNTDRAKLQLELVDRRTAEAVAMVDRGKLGLAGDALRDARPLLADALAVLADDHSHGAQQALTNASATEIPRLAAVFQRLEQARDNRDAGAAADVLAQLNGLKGKGHGGAAENESGPPASAATPEGQPGGGQSDGNQGQTHGQGSGAGSGQPPAQASASATPTDHDNPHPTPPGHGHGGGTGH